MLEASISSHKININFNTIMLASFSCFKMLIEAIFRTYIASEIAGDLPG